MKVGLTQMLRRSLLHRGARALSALTALTVSAAVATALLTLYAGLDDKLHHEFRSFGANIVVTGADLSGEVLTIRKAAGARANVVPFAYVVATTDRGTAVVVAGTEFEQVRALDPWWQVSAWPKDGQTGLLLGSKAAEFVGNEKQLTLRFAGRTTSFPDPVARLTTGGDEDSRIYLSMPEFQALTADARGEPARISVVEVQVPGGTRAVEEALSRLRSALPGVKVEPVRQLVEGESAIVDKTRALMLGAVVLIALTVAVSVLATLSASVLERRRDFALMKALGSSERQLMLLFLSEALVFALGGVVVGWVLGSGAAWLISELNFGTSTLPRVGIVPWVLGLNLAIATLAALFPVRSLRGLEPAALLKGE